MPSRRLRRRATCGRSRRLPRVGGRVSTRPSLAPRLSFRAMTPRTRLRASSPTWSNLPVRTVKSPIVAETKWPSLERRPLRRVVDESRYGGLLGRGVAMLYVSLLVLIPLAALLTNAFNDGLASFWRAITQTEAIDAIRLTLLCSLGAALLNAVAGTATAWIPVSYPHLR